MTDLTTTVRVLETSTVLELAGDLDYGTAARARSVLTDLSLAPGRQLVIDLDGLAFCDSSGIGVLATGYNVAAAAGAGFALTCVPPAVARTLATVGLTTIITIHPTTREAVEAWPSG